MSVVRRGIKNTFRNSVRSVGVIVILAVAIALAISMLIARNAVTKKIDAVRASTGNTVSVSPKGFFGTEGGGTPLTEAQMARIGKIPDVTFVKTSLAQRLNSGQTSLTSAITPGSLGQQFGGGGAGGGGFGGAGAGGGAGEGFSGGAGGGTFTLPIRFTGTNSPGDALTGGAGGGGTEKLVSGSSFAPSSTDDVAVVGTASASANRLSVGSTFMAWNTSIKVIGTYDAGSTFANAGVLMPIAKVQQLAAAPGEVTSATVVVNSVDNVGKVTKAITAEMGSAADVTSTQQTTENELSPLNSVQTISTYTLIGAVVAAGVILLLSMLMIVRERRREIGVLKAIGAPNRSVIAQFITESATFTVLGSVVGLVIGILLGSPITSALVSSSSSSSSSPASSFAGRFPGGGPGGFRGGGGGFGGGGAAGGSPGGFRFSGAAIHNSITQVHAAASWSTLAFCFVAALLVAIIGSTVAVATIVRIRPADVLRSE